MIVCIIGHWKELRKAVYWIASAAATDINPFVVFFNLAVIFGYGTENLCTVVDTCNSPLVPKVLTLIVWTQCKSATSSTRTSTGGESVRDFVI